jgi:hypothetical protein
VQDAAEGLRCFDFNGFIVERELRFCPE